MAQNSTVNSIISLGVTVGIAYAVYKWLSAQCASGSGSILMGSPICSMFSGIFMATPGTVSASAGPAGSGASPLTINGHPVITPAPPPTVTSGNPPAVMPPPVPPSPASIPTSAGGSWGNAVAQLKSVAGTDSLNFDQWAYYWANPGSYSGTMPSGFGAPLSGSAMAAVITAGGGDRNKNISAETFAGLLHGVWVAGGLEGLAPWMGPGGMGVESYLIHGGSR